MSGDIFSVGEKLNIIYNNRSRAAIITGGLDGAEITVTEPQSRAPGAEEIEPGTIVNAVYYHESGVLSFAAECSGIFESDGRRLMSLSMRSPISKYQRRGFKRIEEELPARIRLVARAEELTRSDGTGFFLARYDGKRPREGGGPFLPCATVDISGGGARLYAPEVFSEGSLIEMCVKAGEELEFIFDGVITRAVPDGGNIICVRFVNTDERERRRLVNCVLRSLGLAPDVSQTRA